MRKTTKKWANITNVFINGKWKKLPEYSQWMHMVNRCKTGSSVKEATPCYADCTCDKSWLSYDVYIEWARQQIGFLNRDENGRLWEIDKDILKKHNKIYSPDTCAFIPPCLNKFIVGNKSKNGLPIGVYYADWHKFVAQLKNIHGDTEYLGSHTTPEQAFAAYKQAKESLAKELAIKYTGLVDERVITALNNYTVEITD